MSSQGDTGAERGAQPSAGPQGEDPKQRVNRELREMLEEIRVALPGLELLFGFLLVLPFTDRFDLLDSRQRAVYLVCLVAAAASTALFIAPTVRHRIGFRTVDKEHLLIRTNRQIIGGLFLVWISISMAMYLLVWVVLDARWAWGIAVPVAVWFLVWWLLVPPCWRGARRRRGRA